MVGQFGMTWGSFHGVICPFHSQPRVLQHNLNEDLHSLHSITLMKICALLTLYLWYTLLGEDT